MNYTKYIIISNDEFVILIVFNINADYYLARKEQSIYLMLSLHYQKYFMQLFHSYSEVFYQLYYHYHLVYHVLHGHDI